MKSLYVLHSLNLYGFFSKSVLIKSNQLQMQIFASTQLSKVVIDLWQSLANILLPQFIHFYNDFPGFAMLFLFLLFLSYLPQT